MENLEFRKYAKDRGVRHWQIADELGICEISFSRKIRYPFTKKQEAEYRAAVDRIAARKKEND